MDFVGRMDENLELVVLRCERARAPGLPEQPRARNEPRQAGGREESARDHLMAKLEKTGVPMGLAHDVAGVLAQ